MKQLSRRHALRQLIGMYGAQQFLGAQQVGARGGAATEGIQPPMDDALLEPVNVMDFAKLAQKNLDPAAWDYRKVVLKTKLHSTTTSRHSGKSSSVRKR